MSRGLKPRVPLVDIGAKFGCLTVAAAPRRAITRSVWIFPVRCYCGEESEVVWNRLKLWRATECRCAMRKTCAARMTRLQLRPKAHHETHGFHGSPTYSSWQAMKNRCLNENDEHWAGYGGRGITVCDRWRDSFDNFLADMGERPDGMSIDRIDNDAGYEISNCRWSTGSEQSRNRRRSTDYATRRRREPLSPSVLAYFNGNAAFLRKCRREWFTTPPTRS